MDIKNAKELGKIADICRKKGIAELKMDGTSIEFKLWDVIPSPPKRKSKRDEAELAKDKPIDEIGPTQEEMLFWSSPAITDQVEG